jgi:hypothetical protein
LELRHDGRRLVEASLEEIEPQLPATFEPGPVAHVGGQQQYPTPPGAVDEGFQQPVGGVETDEIGELYQWFFVGLTGVAIHGQQVAGVPELRQLIEGCRLGGRRGGQFDDPCGRGQGIGKMFQDSPFLEPDDESPALLGEFLQAHVGARDQAGQGIGHLVSAGDRHAEQLIPPEPLPGVEDGLPAQDQSFRFVHRPCPEGALPLGSRLRS